ncbi:hypothetical protein [Methanothermobacter sp. K4]|uniref:hypothetical protein n=1 Tax=Methanothermobacter sp. K4 TaxID=2913262 RepID=UPI001ED9F8B8|nr:hypothetical protein [Methanothermobacter sp. K4]MCG2827771.1 hypothetical protein [Methanothermobacter sp. K4]
MHSLRKPNSIRRRFWLLTVAGVDPGSFILISLVLSVIVWGLLMVAAGTNSNCPAGV